MANAYPELDEPAKAALMAVANLAATCVLFARQEGVPSDRVRLALQRFDNANNTMIAHEDSKRYLNDLMAAVYATHFPSTP